MFVLKGVSNIKIMNILMKLLLEKDFIGLSKLPQYLSTIYKIHPLTI